MAGPGKYSLSGPEKAAVLLIALGDEVASKVLQELDDNEIHKLSSYMTTLSNVPTRVVDTVAEEFMDMLESGEGGIISGGKDNLRKMLEASLAPEKVDEIMDKVSSAEDEEMGGGLEAVRNLDPKTIANFLKNEHPQTCAIILAHLDAGHAAGVLKELPERFQPEVAFRMASLERVPPGVIKELDEALAHEFKTTGAMEGSQIGGIEAVAEIVNNLDGNTEKNVLTEIEAINPDMAEAIRQLMFVFEDMINIDDRGIQAALKEVNTDELLLAMKTSSDPLKEKIFSCMSERAALMMKEDLEAMGPVKLSEVETAQQSILRTIKRMEEEGKIVIAGGGEELV